MTNHIGAPLTSNGEAPTVDTAFTPEKFGFQPFQVAPLPTRPVDMALTANAALYGRVDDDPAAHVAAEAYATALSLPTLWEARGKNTYDYYEQLAAAIAAAQGFAADTNERGMAHSRKLVAWFKDAIPERAQLQQHRDRIDGYVAVLSALMQPHANAAHAARVAHDAAVQNRTVTFARTQTAGDRLDSLHTTLGLQAADAEAKLLAAGSQSPQFVDYDDPRYGTNVLQVNPLDAAKPYQREIYETLMEAMHTGRIRLEELDGLIRNATYASGHGDGALEVLQFFRNNLLEERANIQTQLDEIDASIRETCRVMRQNLGHLATPFEIRLPGEESPAAIEAASEPEPPQPAAPPVQPGYIHDSPMQDRPAAPDDTGVDMTAVAVEYASSQAAQQPGRRGRHRQLTLWGRKVVAATTAFATTR